MVDVLRAFTTAAVAFSRGAADIVLTSEVEEAVALRGRLPGTLVMGEVGGLPVPDFDFSNSPEELSRCDLRNRRMIQRTTAGTQGMIRSIQADLLLGASFVVAAATARYLLALRPDSVTFVITGIYPDRDGDEDAACADYIGALLAGAAPDPGPYLRRVRESDSGRMFADPARPEFPAGDLEISCRLDLFDFALPVERSGGLLVMRRS